MFSSVVWVYRVEKGINLGTGISSGYPIAHCIGWSNYPACTLPPIVMRFPCESQMNVPCVPIHREYRNSEIHREFHTEMPNKFPVKLWELPTGALNVEITYYVCA